MKNVFRSPAGAWIAYRDIRTVSKVGAIPGGKYGFVIVMKYENLVIDFHFATDEEAIRHHQATVEEWDGAIGGEELMNYIDDIRGALLVVSKDVCNQLERARTNG